MTDSPMTKKDRDDLIRIAKARGRQAERQAESRQKILYAEVTDQLTATFEADDRLWAEAVAFAHEAVEKANAQIRIQCEALGITAADAPSVVMGWSSRGRSGNRERRAELYKLAEAKLAALTKQAKTAIQGTVLDIETELLVGGFESDQARALLESMPTVEGLMPALSLDDLGVVGWQPAEDAAAQLTTPMTPADRRRRQIRRVIEANPGLSARKLAELAGCDHKTIQAYRMDALVGEITGEFPTEAGE